MKKFVLLIIAMLGTFAAFSQDITGPWYGLLDLGVQKLRLVFNIDEKDGLYSATMDSPDQNAKGIPVTNVTFDNKTLQIKIDNLNLSYQGILDKDTIKGTFTQMGRSFPLILTRTKQEIRRPQNPIPPYPYLSEEIKFENKKAGITLAGTLTFPKEGKKFPVAILVTGSGPQNRDEEIFEHKLFLVLADHLTRQGIAVLRYDDRGTAASGGNYKTATIQDFATDAASAIEYIKSRKELDHQKMGIIGHSLGGCIGFMLAAENNQLAYVVSMAGMAVRGDSLMRTQRYAISTAQGIPNSDIRQAEALITKLNELIQKYTIDSISADPDKYITEALPEFLKENKEAKQSAKQALAFLATPEIQSMLNYDPAVDLKKIKCPVFALNGEKDLQVAADMNLDQIKLLVKSPVTIKKYPGLNHLFQHCNTGLLNEYIIIEETIAPEVLNDIAAWILKVASK